jgi:hypothetical protein
MSEDTTPTPGANTMQLLSGHTSPETAYVVNDYPYGYTLRCTIRYWLEYQPKKGFRLWSQTSNPKRPGLVWNKPKDLNIRAFRRRDVPRRQ